MTYVAFNRLQKQRAAQRGLGLGLILHVALCGGCAARSSGDGDEPCAEYDCVPSTSGLSVVSVTPSDGATNADPSSTIDIEFSRELDPTSVSAESIMVADGDTPVSGVLRCDGRHVVFTPRAKLSLLARYAIVVGSTVMDSDGVPIRHDFTFEFTVRDGNWMRTARPSANRSWLSGLTVDADEQFVLGLWDEVPSVRRYSRGWSSATQVGCDRCFDFLLSGNARGEALAVTVDDNGRAAARQLRDRTWPTQGSTVANLTAYLPQALIAASVAANGEAHVLLVDGKVLRTRQTNSLGVWSDESITVITDTMYFRPVLAFDGHGSGFATWVGHNDDDNSSGVHFVRFESGNVGSVQSIPNSWEHDQSLGQVALAMTATGEAVTVWPGPRGPRSSTYASGEWSPAVSLTDAENSAACAPPAVINDGADFIAAWGQRTDSTSKSCFIHTSRWHDGIWTIPEMLDAGSSGSLPPLLAADALGNLTAVWTRDAHATYARFNRATNSWSTPTFAFDVAAPAAGAIAIARNGATMVAYEDDGAVFTALFE